MSHHVDGGILPRDNLAIAPDELTVFHLRSKFIATRVFGPCGFLSYFVSLNPQL
jgi:hypothetical protein